MTAAELIAFEREVAELFNAGRIRAPVHLDGGNEEKLIEVFKDIAPEDWVFGSWRMHYKCLLKGVPRDVLMAEIVAGRSIALCFPEHRIVSSAIVGGWLSQALGVALSIKRNGGSEHVHCFMGDMTATTGAAHECQAYAIRQGLPIRLIIEDNGKSVCTDTQDAWGNSMIIHHPAVYYRYELPWPHAGAGQRVQF